MPVFSDTYTYTFSGAIDSFTFNGIRLTRPGDQSDTNGMYEEIAVRLADFSQFPAPGDQVMMGSDTYLVKAVRDPLPTDGIANLVLTLLVRGQ